MNIEGQIHPKVIVGIQKQVNDILKKTVDWLKLVPNETDTTDIEADIYGPVGTPYQGGVFRCKLVISSEFPRVAPKGYFLTKIFHPNISEKGEICVNTLKKDWDPKNWSLYGIFEVIKCLLIVPFPESALNEDAAKMFMENYEEYCKYAKLLTELHAIPKSNLLTKFTSSPTKTMTTEKYATMGDNYSPIKQFNLISCNNQSTIQQQYQHPSYQQHHQQQQGEIQLIKENVSESVSLIQCIKSDKGNNSIPINQMNNSSHINTHNIISSNNMLDYGKHSDDVLMTVTNSLNTNNNAPSSLLNLAFKKCSSLNANGNNTNPQIIPNNTCNTNLTASAKKENEKKLWMKRIQ